MTLQEAKQALKEGKKITHIYFATEEYIHLVNGVEYFEDGVEVPHDWCGYKKENNWSIKRD